MVSRKTDVPRHAKTHASDAEFVFYVAYSLARSINMSFSRKLPCPWKDCTFRTLQKSNLDTHYRRQYVLFPLTTFTHQNDASFATHPALKINLTTAQMTLTVNFKPAIPLLSCVTGNVNMGTLPVLPSGTRTRNHTSTSLYASYVESSRIQVP